MNQKCTKLATFNKIVVQHSLPNEYLCNTRFWQHILIGFSERICAWFQFSRILSALHFEKSSSDFCSSACFPSNCGDGSSASELLYFWIHLFGKSKNVTSIFLSLSIFLQLILVVSRTSMRVCSQESRNGSVIPGNKLSNGTSYYEFFLDMLRQREIS